MHSLVDLLASFVKTATGGDQETHCQVGDGGVENGGRVSQRDFTPLELRHIHEVDARRHGGDGLQLGTGSIEGLGIEGFMSGPQDTIDSTDFLQKFRPVDGNTLQLDDLAVLLKQIDALLWNLGVCHQDLESLASGHGAVLTGITAAPARNGGISIGDGQGHDQW